MLRLQEILDERKISAKELAEKTGITPVSISNIVQGKHSPKLSIIEKIAEALNLEVRDLFSQKNDKISLIINDKLHTFYSMAELKAFIEKDE